MKSTLPVPGAKLRQIVQDKITSDFKIHLLFDEQAEDGDIAPFEYHAHKKWLVLRTRDEGAIKAGFRLALMAQLGGVWLGKGPCTHIAEVPGDPQTRWEQYQTWGAVLERAIYA